MGSCGRVPLLWGPGTSLARIENSYHFQDLPQVTRFCQLGHRPKGSAASHSATGWETSVGTHELTGNTHFKIIAEGKAVRGSLPME